MHQFKLFKPALLLGALGVLVASITAPAAAQRTGTIRGVVTDAGSGRPIEGVQVSVEGTRIGAITNEEGRYELANVPSGGVRVRVRMIGYSSQLAEATVGAAPVELNIALRESVIALDAVVVTGTGAAVEKKQLGNTIATLDMANIEEAPVQSFSEALTAREPSVTINASSGIAGAGSRIRIRGSNSLSMTNEPVVYVDGVRIDAGSGQGYNAVNPSRLDDLDPNAIERVEILKGAAAATLYGSEASSGVIQIFTKKGSQGRPRFSFRVEQGISQYPDVYHPNAGFARTQAQADTINEVYANTPGWTNVQPYEVFQRQFMNDIFETGWQQTYSASVTGGGETVNYFVSGRFNRDDGPLGVQELGPTRDIARRVQGTASLTIFPRERLSFRIGTLFTDSKVEIPSNGNSIYGVYALTMFGKPELAYCRDLDGDGNQDVAAGHIGETMPMCETQGNATGNAAFMTTREAMQYDNVQDAEHFNGNLTASYRASDEINLEGTFGIDVTNSDYTQFRYFRSDVDRYTSNDRFGARYIDARHHRELTLDLKGTWDKRFSNLSSALTVGAQGFISTETNTWSDGDVFPGPGIEVVGAAANIDAFEGWLQVVNTGLFAQEQIGYNDYAYFTFGGRWDKNSAFGENTGGAFYPKGSLSLVFSDMPSWNSSLLSTFRIRAAVGKSGQQPGAFDQFNTYQSGTTWLGAGLRPDNLGNEDLKPEKSIEYEAGAEFGLFENIMGLEATYWRRKTTDALVNQQFPVSGGFSNLQLVNIGELRGQGLELKFDWLALSKENVTASVFVSASYLKEEIRSMGTAPPIKVGGSYPRYRNFLMPPWDTDGDGTPDQYFAPGAFFGAALVDYTPGSTVPYDTDGDGEPDSEATFLTWLGDQESVSVDQSEMTPLVRDDDGDGDRLDHYLGKPTPDWTGSFGTTITLWENFDISSLFEFRTGNYYVTNLTDAFRKSNATIGRNTPEAAQAEATLADPSSSAEQRLGAAMEWATEFKALSPLSGLNTIYDAKFLRLREISLTWRAPASFSTKLGLDNLVFSLSGRNLLKFSNYTGIDQESNYQGSCTGSGTDCNFGDGVDAFGTPLPRRYTLAVQFGF
jgi:TonB-linked SusC/RagA family outer membrane protein